MRSFWMTFRSQGYVRVRVDGELRDLSEEIKLEKNKKHNIEVVVDRIIVKPGVEHAAYRLRRNSSEISGRRSVSRCDRRGRAVVQFQTLLARSAVLALRNCLPACSPLTVLMVLVRLVTDWGARWKSIRNW